MKNFQESNFPIRLTAAALGFLVFAAWPGPAKAENKFHVLEIHIIGNTDTPDSMIRSQLPFRPGQMVSRQDLRLALRALNRVPLWEMPSIMVLDWDGKPNWKEVVIQVHERPWNWLLFVGYDLALFRITGNPEHLTYVHKQIHFRIMDWLGKP